MHKPNREFHHPHYLNLNLRRLEHLASLGLSFRGRHVAELGAGIGDLSCFFLSQGARLTLVEGRPENIGILQDRFPKARFPDVEIVEMDLDSPLPIPGQPFDVVFSYGILYHLADPVSAIEWMASICKELLILETCVSAADADAVEEVREDSALYSQALGGIASRPGRNRLYRELSARFPHVCVPETQPDHEEFPPDWRNPTPSKTTGLTRAIFIGSEHEPDRPGLLPGLPETQPSFSAGPIPRPSALNTGFKPSLSQEKSRKETREKIRFDPDFTIARKYHFKRFAQSSRALYGTGPDLECNLKIYQDLLVYTFITDHLPPGARLLEVGGGESRVLEKLSEQYECWNLDKLEGVGYGPGASPEPLPYRLVRAYAGEFSPEVPDHYFDMVFSISALEHTPRRSPDLYAGIAGDMDRALKRGGFSLHCLDAVLSAGMERAYYDHIFYEGSLKGAGEIRMADFSPVPEKGIHAYCPDIAAFFRNLPHLAAPVPDLPPAPDPFIWTMPQKEYDTTWKKYVTKIEYERFGMPTSLNILWRKPLQEDPAGPDAKP